MTQSTPCEVRNFGAPAATARVPQIALRFRIGAGIAAFAEVCSAHHRSRWEEAGFDFAVHPHQLRHACGYFLASKGHDTRAIQDYLGHRDIHHTVRYTKMAPQRFESFWED